MYWRNFSQCVPATQWELQPQQLTEKDFVTVSIDLEDGAPADFSTNYQKGDIHGWAHSSKVLCQRLD